MNKPNVIHYNGYRLTQMLDSMGLKQVWTQE